jgi:hypothetical protein
LELIYGFGVNAFVKSRMEPLEALISVRFSDIYKRQWIREFERFVRQTSSKAVQVVSRNSSFVIRHSGREDVRGPVRI